MPVMDLFIRESRAIVHGPMLIVRYGTCGGISPDAVAGSVIVNSHGSGYVSRNHDYFLHPNDSASGKPYNFFELCPADKELSEAVVQSLHSFLDPLKLPINVIEGANVAADFFYGTQGRHDENFDDHNEHMIEEVHKHYPTAKSLEMESYLLMNYSKCCKQTIRATSAAMALSNRDSAVVVEDSVFEQVETVGGHAILHAVAHAAL